VIAARKRARSGPGRAPRAKPLPPGDAGASQSCGRERHGRRRAKDRFGGVPAMLIGAAERHVRDHLASVAQVRPIALIAELHGLPCRRRAGPASPGRRRPHALAAGNLRGTGDTRPGGDRSRETTAQGCPREPRRAVARPGHVEFTCAPIGNAVPRHHLSPRSSRGAFQAPGGHRDARTGTAPGSPPRPFPERNPAPSLTLPSPRGMRRRDGRRCQTGREAGADRPAGRVPSRA
jgi:hypothetical protein